MFLKDGYLPLDVAMQQGHGKLVASLLENDPSNTVALPALHVAAKKNDTKTASFLVENGFAINTPSKVSLRVFAHLGLFINLFILLFIALFIHLLIHLCIYDWWLIDWSLIQ